MKSFYSIIRIVSNQWSNENIVVGLLVVSEKNFFYRVSEEKVQLSRRFKTSISRILGFSIDQFKIFMDAEKKKFEENWQAHLPLEEPKLTYEFVKKLHQYSAGVLQFSAPEMINKTFDQESFDQYFEKFVGGLNKVSRNSILSSFTKKIQSDLYAPLKGKIDVDYKLKKESLPSLYFDYHLDNIGVNGAIIASSSVDLNNERIDALQKKLAEYESVIDRLEKLAVSKNLGSDHSFYLIADSYKGKTPSNMELDNMLQGKINDKFKRVSTSELNQIVKQVKEKNATKFSEWISE